MSPYYNIPDENLPAAYLFHVTADIVVEVEQSQLFAEALKRKGGVVKLEFFQNYDHTLSSTNSDK